jgi:hypothetical protein
MNSTDQQYFVRKNHLTSAPMGDELVMMDVDKGKYLGLNPVAATIWSKLDSPKTIAELVTLLCNEYEVDVQRCTQDVEKFMAQLIANELVEAV